jgi:2-hydroxychromene-2-carboxylate isomerase
MFRAAWQDRRDISNKQVVAELARPLGLDLEDPSLKDALREATDVAVKRGVFGVPTFFVGDEMFWGHDRMHHVVRAAKVRAHAER